MATASSDGLAFEVSSNCMEFKQKVTLEKSLVFEEEKEEIDFD